jgi:RNA polymerase sigma factor (sigma-70 family)
MLEDEKIGGGPTKQIAANRRRVGRVRRLRGPASLRRVAQDSFLAAYKSLPQLGDPAKFAGWLYAITRNRARRVGTQESARRTEPLSVIDEFIVAKSSELGEGQFDQVERRLESARLVAELAHIPPEYSRTLELYYSQEWPVERIADFFIVPRSTVKWRLFQGRKLLRERLGEQADPEPAE